MFKKSLLAIVLFSISPITEAHEYSSSLLVKPIKPTDWAFHGAAYRVNNEPLRIVLGDRITVKMDDVINLIDVGAMNVSPRIHSSCKNLKISQEGQYILTFSLQADWFIHCQLDIE